MAIQVVIPITEVLLLMVGTPASAMRIFCWDTRRALRRSSPLLDRALSTKTSGLYFTDTFRVTSKLTLDYGLRWDYEGIATYADGLIYTFNPATDEVIVPASKVNDINPLFPGLIGNATIVTGNPQPTPDLGNWGPRFGVAYHLPGNMVIRGGYGLYWQRYTRFLNGSQQGYYEGPFWPLADNYNDPTFPSRLPDVLRSSSPTRFQAAQVHARSVRNHQEAKAYGIPDALAQRLDP